MYEVKHPIWGSNLANQLLAGNAKDYGEDGNGNIIITVPGFFGGEKQKKEYIGYIERPATDEDEVLRKFRYRCGLLKIMATQGRDGLRFVVFLDGHITSEFVSSEMEFRLAPDELQANDGKPIAEIWFYGKGKRFGSLSNYGTSRIIYTFADKAQVDQHLDVTNRRMPKTITHKGVTYRPTSSGTYQSNDGSILPGLVLAYLMLSPSEQPAFMEQNPEMKGMLFDGGESGGGGRSRTFEPDGVTIPSDQAPADGITYEDGGGAQSDNTDFGGTDGGSSDLDGGSSDSGGDSSSD